jgi:hypothetical protein
MGDLPWGVFVLARIWDQTSAARLLPDGLDATTVDTTTLNTSTLS